jgi:hypothetical protein
MIPDSWRPLLQDPEASERTYERLTSRFRWEDEHQEEKLRRLMTDILHRAFQARGAMSPRVFENELSGHLGPYHRPSLQSATLHLSPEQEDQLIREEFDTEIYEAMSYRPSSILSPHPGSDSDYISEPLPRQPSSAKPFSPTQVRPVVVGPVERVLTKVSRQLRDTDLVARLKEAYGYRCQFCETSIPMGRGRGWYCEAHHIRPLGSPHHGTDTADNIMIVCPNHHKLLDYGSIVIDLSTLALLHHNIADSNVRYHNEELHNRA